MANHLCMVCKRGFTDRQERDRHMEKQHCIPVVNEDNDENEKSCLERWQRENPGKIPFPLGPMRII